MEIEVVDNEQRGKIYMLEGDKCYEKNSDSFKLCFHLIDYKYLK